MEHDFNYKRSNRFSKTAYHWVWRSMLLQAIPQHEKYAIEFMAIGPMHCTCPTAPITYLVTYNTYSAESGYRSKSDTPGHHLSVKVAFLSLMLTL
jgi:hypothetical protein